VARDYNLIQQPELLDRLRAFIGVRGQRSLVPTMNMGVQATILLADLSQNPKPIYRRAGSGSSQPAVALNFSRVRLTNPLASGKRLRIVDVIVSTGAALQNARFVPRYDDAALLAGPISPVYWDFPRPRPAGIPNFSTDGVFVSIAANDLVLPAINWCLVSGESTVGRNHLMASLVVEPGDSLDVYNETINASITVGFIWDEEPTNR